MARFPLAETQVLDEELHWPVGGQHRKLPGEDFELAFSKVKSLASSWKRHMPITRQKFMAFKAWQQRQAINELRKTPPYEYEFPFSEVTPVDDLEQIQWEDAVGVQRSKTGTAGVLFVELPNKKAVVVKVPDEAAAEMYGTSLCQMLKIPCPRMRVLASSSAEGQQIQQALTRLDGQRDEAARKVATMFKGKPAILIIEFLQGTELADILPTVAGAESHIQWCKDAFGLPGESLTKKGRRNLKMFGRLIVLDMMINNYDRLPCIWDNQGNPGNVMFWKDHTVVSIDNMLNCIGAEHPQVIQKHIQKVRSTAGLVLSDRDSIQREFFKVREFLKDGCPKGCGWPGLGIDIGDEGVRLVQAGFRETVELVTTGSVGQSAARPSFSSSQSPWSFRSITEPLTTEVLRQMKFQLQEALGDANFEAINPEFMGAVAETLRDVFLHREDGQAFGPAPSLAVAMVGKSRSLEDVMVFATGETERLGR